MTPIPFPLPRRILPPTVAHAAGLVCEHRPDLADGVRAAVLGDAAVTALDVVTLARVEAGDEQGAQVLACLREIVHYGGDDPKSLHGLADLFGLIPRRDKGMTMHSRDNVERVGDPTICDVVRWPYVRPFVVGLGSPGFAGIARALEGADLLNAYLREGWGAAWGQGTLPGEREALRRLIPLHAHTISLDADTRAAWAKAHLDALNPPIRPQSPDRLT